MVCVSLESSLFVHQEGGEGTFPGCVNRYYVGHQIFIQLSPRRQSVGNDIVKTIARITPTCSAPGYDVDSARTAPALLEYQVEKPCANTIQATHFVYICDSQNPKIAAWRPKTPLELGQKFRHSFRLARLRTKLASPVCHRLGQGHTAKVVLWVFAILNFKSQALEL